MIHKKIILLTCLIIFKYFFCFSQELKEYNNNFLHENIEKDKNPQLTTWGPNVFLIEKRDSLIQYCKFFNLKRFLKSHLFLYKENDLEFHIDILPNITIIKEINNPSLLYTNTRGFYFKGSYKKKLYLQSDFFESQAKFPEYLDAFSRKNIIVPGQGGLKGFNNSIDFAYSSSRITYLPNKFFDLTLGYGKNFIGNGYRSVLLSDIGFNYPFVKTTVKFGNFEYSSMWAQFIDRNLPPLSINSGYRKKWGVFHYLEYNIKKISFGFFESIIWQDQDSSSKRGFDYSYLNPLLFLRPVEASNGSPDNSLIGFNLKFKLKGRDYIYSQILLDEFKINEFFSSKNWWGNKFAYQVGIKKYDLFKFKNLNIQIEYNTARPYTYSHTSSIIGYSHFNQPLAHILGANFKEFLSVLTYSKKNSIFRIQFNKSIYGLNLNNNNYGKNIFLSYDTRVSDYGITTGQGLKTNLLFIDNSYNYIINKKTGLRIVINLILRKEVNNITNTNSTIFNFGLQSGFRNLYYDF